MFYRMSYLIKRTVAFVFVCAAVLLYSCDNGNSITGATLNDNEFAVQKLKGSHTAMSPSAFNVPVELGTQYNSISNVSVRIEGLASPGRTLLTDTGEEIDSSVEFHIYMAESFEPGIFSLLTPVAVFNLPGGNFKEQITLAPLNQPIAPDWAFLENGIATVRFSWGSICPHPHSCKFIELPTVQISSAILMINGNAIE